MTDHTIDAGVADLLIELGCEELPPKALDRIRDAFFSGVLSGLEKSDLEFSAEKSRALSTPRRLAMIIGDVAPGQPDQNLERRGPALRAAFDEEGKPTGAALGFARSVGREVGELETVKTDKGEWLFCKIHQAGKPLQELIYPIIEQAIRQLPVPKPMRWADNDFSFVRPVHWLVVMHGEEVIEGSLFGLSADRLTRGHRIHNPGPHSIASAGDFEKILEDAFVIADPETRKERIRSMALQADKNVLIDPALLDEVKNLVEWPVAVSCRFEEEFLKVPHAALIASMQDHQKFFPVLEAPGTDRVNNHFVVISNVDSTNFDEVREGYERVIRPRLADARFFLEQDEKEPLDQLLPRLDRVVFQQKIGSVGDKSRRISVISEKITEIISQEPETSSRAALLAKCDLLTHMVGEFPELQGLMGAHYARKSGESEAVASAIGEHYQPRFAGDDIPETDAGRIVSLADRIDTLVGIFAAGLKPTGNKDPFALRRAALGTLRILLEGQLNLSLDHLIETAANSLSAQISVSDESKSEVRSFMIDRLKHYYTEQGFSTGLIQSALASGWLTLPDLDRRVRAIRDFMGCEEATSLAAANKRIGNILRKSENVISGDIETERFVYEEEERLFAEINRVESEIEALFSAGEYEAYLSQLASLREPVDAYFDEVMVMDENLDIRANRLALLARLKGLFDRVADLSVLG